MASTEVGEAWAKMVSLKAPVPQPRSSQWSAGGGDSHWMKAWAIRRLQRPMKCS